MTNEQRRKLIEQFESDAAFWFAEAKRLVADTKAATTPDPAWHVEQLDKAARWTNTATECLNLAQEFRAALAQEATAAKTPAHATLAALIREYVTSYRQASKARTPEGPKLVQTYEALGAIRLLERLAPRHPAWRQTQWVF